MLRQVWRITCDLCGRDEENAGYNAWRYKVPVLVENKWGGHTFKSEEFDLCPDCIDRVTVLFKQEYDGDGSGQPRLRDDGRK